MGDEGRPGPGPVRQPTQGTPDVRLDPTTAGEHMGGFEAGGHVLQHLVGAERLDWCGTRVAAPHWTNRTRVVPVVVGPEGRKPFMNVDVVFKVLKEGYADGPKTGGSLEVAILVRAIDSPPIIFSSEAVAELLGSVCRQEFVGIHVPTFPVLSVVFVDDKTVGVRVVRRSISTLQLSPGSEEVFQVEDLIPHS